MRKRLSLLAGISLVVALGASFVGTAPAGADTGVTVRAFGGAPSLGAPTQQLNAPLVGIASSRSGKGYWLLAQDGGIFTHGKAKFYGSTGAMHLNQPVVGIAPTTSGRGYWLVAADGGIFTFGNAHFHGSTGAMRLNSPIVGMAATPGGRGYWLVAADGGVFSFGNARFKGSTGGFAVGSPIVGITSTKSGHGYWIAAADGRIFNFGDAQPMRAVPASSPIVGITRGADAGALWLVASDGSVFTAGRARYFGNARGTTAQAVGIAASGGGNGYWVAMGPTGPPLPPNSGTGRRIVYSNSQQRLWLVEANGVVSHTYLVSGRHGLPAVGVHHVYSKVPTSPSGNLALPWTLRFAWSTRGNPIDIHGIPIDPSGREIQSEDQLGTPLSHGCLRMAQRDAKFVWDWSTLGTTVVVTDLGY